MARIVHLAIKVMDLEAATKFYEEVFGFRQVKTGRNGQHVSRHMTDGNIDLALMVYDSEEAKEAQLAGPGPRLHHWGIEVDDRDTVAEKIKAHGGTILSDKAAGALKFRAPDGTVAEVVRQGRYADAVTKKSA
ncbi:MAG: VOC family protein [Proteobacteria bacterium]|nr:VOC family protein [Pseudomonadota bacterium]MBI3499617.1 VOC family protein [Pseudomonadota bacterium]